MVKNKMQNQVGVPVVWCSGITMFEMCLNVGANNEHVFFLTGIVIFTYDILILSTTMGGDCCYPYLI